MSLIVARQPQGVADRGVSMDRPSRLSANDVERSCTSSNLAEVTAALVAASAHRRPAALLDVGCGYGGIAATLADHLGVEEAHGVDVDPVVMAEARAKGVRAVQADVSAGPLPYGDDAFDVLTCFGMLDYLPWYDTAVREFARVLRPGGLVAIALPNLGGWHNRLALLCGYQPRDVEFCSVRTVGVAPSYRDRRPVGHLHSPTTRAFREFMAVMGFSEVRTHALRPANVRPPGLLRLLDAGLGRFPGTARRFLYLGRSTGRPAGGDGEGWWSP